MNKPHTYGRRRRITDQRWRPPSQHLLSTHIRLDSSPKGLHTPLRRYAHGSCTYPSRVLRSCANIPNTKHFTFNSFIVEINFTKSIIVTADMFKPLYDN